MQGLQWPPCMTTPGVGRPPAIGRIFYVRSDGSDVTGNGVDPGTPFASITHALTQCTAWKNDYIVVMNNCSANEASYPIAVAKELVHIIGLWGEPYPNPTLMATDDNATFRLEVDWIEIAGFELGAGAAHACIESLGTAVTKGYWWIHHNAFGYITAEITAQDGIGVLDTDDAPQCVFEDNIFGSALTRDGIRLDGNATRSIIRNNIFRDVPGIGIHARKNGSDIGAILWNYFKTARGGAVGAAITFLVGVGNALVSDNRATEDAEAPGMNPYKDFSTGAVGTTLNAWGVNYKGSASTFPDVS